MNIKKLIQIPLFLLIINNCFGQNLKIIYGNNLYYFNKDKAYQIKKISNISNLHGYDVIDSVNIFIAYTPNSTEEESCYITVYNIIEKEEKIIEEIGSTGESFFQYNHQNKLVVFNWYDGIYTFKLHENYNIGKKLKIMNRLTNDQCFLPFWISKNRIGYYIWKNGESELRYLNIE